MPPRGLRALGRAVFAIALLAAGPAAAGCEPGETAIRLAAPAKSTLPGVAQGLAQLREAIDTALQGKACVEPVVDEASVGDSVLLATLSKGDVHMGVANIDTVAQAASAYGIYRLPFAMRDLDAVLKFSSAARRELAKPLAAFGLVPLEHWLGRFDIIAADRAVLVPADLAGARVWLPASGDRIELGRALKITLPDAGAEGPLADLGAGRLNAASTSWRELAVPPRAVDRATASGTPATAAPATAPLATAAPATVVAGKGAPDTAVQTSETNHRYRGGVLLANAAFLEALEPGVRATLAGLLERFTRTHNGDVGRRAGAAGRVVMRREAPVWTVSDAQRDLWRAAAAPVWNAWRPARREILLGLLADANRMP